MRAYTSDLPTRNFHLPRLLFLCLLLFVCQGSLANAAPTSSSNTLIRLGFHWNTFSGVERKDAMVSLQVWSDIVAKDMGFQYRTTTEIIDDAKELLQKLQRGDLEVAVIAPWEFLSLENRSNMDPIISSVEQNSLTQPHVLLVHAQSGMSELRHLKGRTIIVNDFGVADTALRWLDTLLAREKCEPPEAFFSQITRSQAISKVVHPVFFKKADACIANANSLSTLVELNPQIGKNLRTLSLSPPLPSGFVLARGDMDPEMRKAFINSTLRLDTHTKGQQILALFKIKRLAPFEASSIEAVETILKEWRKLRGMKQSANSGAQP